MRLKEIEFSNQPGVYRYSVSQLEFEPGLFSGLQVSPEEELEEALDPGMFKSLFFFFSFTKELMSASERN